MTEPLGKDCFGLAEFFILTKVKQRIPSQQSWYGFVDKSDSEEVMQVVKPFIVKRKSPVPFYWGINSPVLVFNLTLFNNLEIRSR